MKQSVVFKGIVKGAYSDYQANGLDENPVMTFQGDSVHEVLCGLTIEEWIFVLKVNGRRIKKVVDYIKRKGLNDHDYMRQEAIS